MSDNTLIGEISARNSLNGEINNGIERIYPSLIDLEVTPTIEKQTFNHVGSYGYDEVVVNAIDIQLQDKTATPTTSSQTITADEGYTALNEVTVSAVTSSIDSNIVASNIKAGVSILGVIGNVNSVQTGTITPTTTGSDVEIVTGISARNFVIYESAEPQIALGARFIAGIFISSIYQYGLRTNSAGSALGVLNSKSATFGRNSVTIKNDSMSRMCAGYTYTWFAW